MSAENTRMYWLHAVSPVHVGTGTGVGFIDLPIMREKTTEWPMIPGSAVKGVRRDAYEREAGEKGALIRAAFGKADEEGDGGSNAGALVFTDARLLCLPVASYYGTFAWVTSPMALKRHRRDALLAGMADFGAVPTIGTDGPQALVSAATGVDRSVLLAQNEAKVYLSDLDLPAAASPEAAKWARGIANALFGAQQPDARQPEWRGEFEKRFLVANDNTFNFLCRSACEVQARVHIDNEKKTVKAGQLWYEEALPAESILSGLVWCDRVYEKDTKVTESQLMASLCSGELSLQVGGKATVGRGRMRCVFGR